MELLKEKVSETFAMRTEDLLEHLRKIKHENTVSQVVDTTTISYLFKITFPPVIGKKYRNVNFGRRKVFVSEMGLAYRQAVREDIERSSTEFKSILPFTVPLAVELTVYPPDKRKRDINSIQETVMNALGNSGLWADDKLVRSSSISQMAPIDRAGFVTLTVTTDRA